MNNPSLFFVFPSTAYIHLFNVRVDHNVSAVIPLPPPPPHPPDMSPHILSVLTSITQPPRSALLTPVLIPCVCQIKRPRPVWFSHVSSSLFSPPPRPPPHPSTHTSRNAIWQQMFCYFLYCHTLHPSSLHLILLFTCELPSFRCRRYFT